MTKENLKIANGLMYNLESLKSDLETLKRHDSEVSGIVLRKGDGSLSTVHYRGDRDRIKAEVIEEINYAIKEAEHKLASL